MARSRKRHRRKSHALSNPFSVKGLMAAPKEMLTADFATQAVSTAAGFMLPNIVLGMVPPSLRDSKLKLYGSKVVVIAALSAAVAMVNKKASRGVMVGGGVALLLDLWGEWQARSTPKPAGTAAYYGEDGTAAYYGDDANLSDDFVLS